jgi:dolichyl-phosphate beta-glucosyltransferase
VIDEGITIVIPAFNEERRLPATLDRLMAEIPEVWSGRWEVVVSDDGSADRTVELARAREEDGPVRVLSCAVNRGKGAALLVGALEAVHPVVLFLDADLPVPVPLLVWMAERTAHADLVVGSRRLPGASFDPPQPLVRQLGGHAFRAAVAALGYDITSDPQCGVKALRRDRLAPILAEMTSSGFGFDVELIERTRRAGMEVSELPVAWRHVEGSSLRPTRDALSTLRELMRLRGALDGALQPSLTPSDP